MRYAGAAVLCATSVLFIALAAAAGSLPSLLLGLSGVVASAGMVIHKHQALRLACAAILLAFIYRRNLRSAGGQHVAVLAVIVAIVGMPVLARAIERML